MEKNDISRAIKSYINHDSDHIIQSTTIISLFVNIKYINCELKELVIEKIKDIFDDNNYEDEYKNNIVDTIINSLYNECLKYEIKDKDYENNKENDKDLLNEVINRIMQMNFMKNYFNNEKIDPLIIINFVKINLILKNCTLYKNCYGNYLWNNTNNQVGTITIEDLLIKIHMNLFQNNSNNNNNNNSINSNNINNNNNIQSNSFVEENSNENLKKLFIINLYKIIPCLNNLKNSKCLYEKINNLFRRDSIISILNRYEEEFSTNNYIKNYNYFYKFLLCLLEQSQSILIIIQIKFYS